MPRELSKCREWEKDRRERLKKGFSSLCKILPCYEPSLTFSKIEILQKAQAYIEELQTQIKELLDGKSTKPECSTIKKLHDRVRKLVIRNEQLCNLLIDAGIKLPSECGNVKKFRGTKIWSNRITPEQAKKLLKKEKENDQKKPKKKLQTKNKKTKVRPQRKMPRRDIIGTQTITTNLLQSSNFITLVTTQSCFIITNAPSTNVNQNCLTKTTTVLTNSNLFSTPLVASTVKPPLVITKGSGAINAVSSGTLLVANGSLLPVIQQSTLVPTQTIITNPAPIVVKPAASNNTTLFVVPKSDVKDASTNSKQTPATNSVKNTINPKTTNVLKSLPLLKPKKSDLTKTTHVNKVPIPALTSKYASDLISQVTSLQNVKSKVKSNKNTKREVNAKSKKPEEDEEKIKIDETQTITETNTLNKNSENSALQTEKNDPNTEPTVKKLKLTTEDCPADSSEENKKINIISAYTIDSLCNESIDPSSTVTRQSTDKLSSVKDIQIEASELSDVGDGLNKKDQGVEKKNETTTAVPRVQTQTGKEEEPKVEEVLKVVVDRSAIDTNIQRDKIESVDNKNKQNENQKGLELNNALMHSDLSNDIFASLSHVSTGGGQNPESTSPTAAFLLAFPLVSSLNSLKVTEVIEDEVTESQRGTPTLLQIGTMDTTKPTQSQSDTLTPSLLNLDNFSFFSREFYPSFDPIVTSSSLITSSSITTTTPTKTCEAKKDVIDFNVTLPEKKPMSEAQPKDELKYALKSAYDKESSVYRNNKDIGSRCSSIVHPNVSVAKISKNIPPVCQSISSISSSQSISSVCQKGSIAPICRSSSVVSQNNSLTSMCQDTSVTPFYQNSTITTQSTCIVPSTSISGSQNTSTKPQYQNSTSASQSAPQSSTPVCQNAFISSFCQTSSANGSLIAPSTISHSQNTSITPFYESSTVVHQNTSLVPSSLLPVSQSGASSLYENSAVVSRSTSFIPPLASVGQSASIVPRYQDGISQSTSLVPVCQNALTAPACHGSTVVSYSASLNSISHNSSATTLCQSTSTASLYHKTSIPSVCQNSAISNLNTTSTSVSESITLRPTTTVVSQNSSILPIPQNVPTVSVCQNITSLANTNFNTIMSCTSSEYSLAYNHPFYSNTQTVPTTSSTVVSSTKHQIDKSKMEKKSCNYYPTTTSYSVPQYNTFNPFTDIPKSTTYPISTKSYNDALYTSNTTYSYNYHPDNFTTYSTTKSNIKPDKLYCGLNYDNYDYKHNEFQKYDTRNQQFGNYYSQNHASSKEKTSSESSNKNHNLTTNNNKATVNWMTTPDVRQHIQNDFIIPSLGKEVDFAPNPIYSSNSFSGPQATYFNTNTSLYASNDLHNNASFPTIPPNSFQRNELEENQFSWSPSKLPQLLDTTHNFVSGTLPTLVGDLALGNTQPFVDQKMESKNIKDFRVKDNSRRSKSSTNYDNQTNFLSVSQLVDHNKSDAIPGRVGNRRNSGNRSSNKNSSSSKSVKRKTEKDVHNFNNKIVEKQIKHNNHEYQSQNNENSNWMSATKNRNVKVPSSSYSAEALIGHQNQTDLNRTRSTQNYSMVNKALPVPFLTDNIIPYFPMDIPQDNTLVQQNQNYQPNAFTHNFPSTIQGTVYSNSTFVPNPTPITTSYLPSTNFIPDIGTNNDYPPILPENTFTHVKDKISKNKSLGIEKSNDKRNMAQSNNNCSVNSLTTSKKSKKKQHNEPPNLSNLDFSFLSMPTAINSPILPDDFQAHTSFLPPPTPTQLYPCKNPLYNKQDLATNSLLTLPAVSRSGVAHPEISPSLNNVGTTLTNFNLSTIFPEINKGSGSMPIYPENGKAKDYNPREFLPSTSQVRFKQI